MWKERTLTVGAGSALLGSAAALLGRRLRSVLGVGIL